LLSDEHTDSSKKDILKNLPEKRTKAPKNIAPNKLWKSGGAA